MGEGFRSNTSKNREEAEKGINTAEMKGSRQKTQSRKRLRPVGLLFVLICTHYCDTLNV